MDWTSFCLLERDLNLLSLLEESMTRSACCGEGEEWMRVHMHELKRERVMDEYKLRFLLPSFFGKRDLNCFFLLKKRDGLLLSGEETWTCSSY